ncbi:MAG TPA: glycoside hydrolase family 2 TIM barrel-domain containing protein [Bacteroidota bacterium]|nr:glycoside hydrolase family 2 TIM barrel-domain containing protein [Bacteroidota bacterium]
MQISSRRYLLALVFLLAAPTLAPSKTFIFENGRKSRPDILNYSSPSRSVVDLSGRWNCSTDEGATWKEVLVPSAFDIEGKVIFTRKFDLPPALLASHSFKFVAYGINYQAEIYLNEVFVGKHEGGYTSFSFLVPENTIQFGSENVIRIVVDNTLNSRSTLPLRQQIGGWKNYGGIFRDVFLVATPLVWIDDLVSETESIDPKMVKLNVHAVISGRDFSKLFSGDHGGPAVLNFTVECSDKATGLPAGKSIPISLSPGINKDVSVQTTVTIPGAKMWSPDQPNLYTLHAVLAAGEGKNSVVVDECTIHTGIRTIGKQKQSVMLNGAAVTLRGMIWGEDTPDHGSAMTYEQMEKDVALIKNLGANAVRFSFHPPHPYLLDLCDQYGLLAFEEIPLYETPADIFSTENYRALADNYLKEMIRRDRSHPSLVAWGFGDGFESIDPRAKLLLDQLQGTARSMDSRLTYYISLSLDDVQNSSLVDLAGVRLVNADLKGFTSSLQRWKASHPEQPLIVGQYGKAVETGNRNGYSDPMSQEAQARYLFQRYDAIKGSNIAASFVWSFSDWRGDRPMLSVQSNTPDLYTQGIVEFNREKKVSYDVVRSMFLGEKIAALPVGTHSTSSPVSYVLLGLVLLILFFWLLNSDRRFREGVFRALRRPYNFYADIRDQRILSNLHTAILSAIVAVTFAIVVSSVLYHFRTSMVLDYILTMFITSDSLKAIIIELIWHPIQCIAYCGLVCFAWMFIVMVLVQFLSFFVRTKVYLFHSYSVAVWSTLPMVIFIPLGMILYRVMESEVYVVPVLVIFGAVMVWILFRTLKGISIIYDSSSVKIYAIAIVVFAVLGLLWYGYFDYAHATMAYIHFMMSTVVPAAN